MPRLTADQWETIRAEREATGASYRELGAKHGVSDVTVMNRAKKEGWSDGKDVAEIVRRRAAEKVSGILSGANPKKRADAIEATASKVAAVVERHQREWDLIGSLQDEALRDRAEQPEQSFVKAKLAKISAETLAIKQTGERKAYGLDKEDTTPTIVIERGTV